MRWSQNSATRLLDAEVGLHRDGRRRHDVAGERLALGASDQCSCSWLSSCGPALSRSTAAGRYVEQVARDQCLGADDVVGGEVGGQAVQVGAEARGVGGAAGPWRAGRR